MAIVESDFIPVPKRATALGQPLPASLTLLPENFEDASPGDELRFRGEATTITKIFRQAGLPIERLGAGGEIAFIHNRSHDWALPIIYIGTELIQQNPDLARTAIELIRDYVVELFRAAPDKTIKTEIVIEDRARKRYRKLSYEGDAAGLDDLAKLVDRLSK